MYQHESARHKINWKEMEVCKSVSLVSSVMHSMCAAELHGAHNKEAKHKAAQDSKHSQAQELRMCIAEHTPTRNTT